MTWFFSASSSNTPATANTATKSECPVDHKKLEKDQTSTEAKCPVNHGRQQEEAKCPVKHSSDSELAADNKIPVDLKNKVADGQKYPLPTDRQISTIPRGQEEEERWVYPSQQQFYNALKRKNFETDERDIESILLIHNDMNERCWQEIVRQERLLSDGGCEPRLLRFAGRPSEMTPKARVMSGLGLAPAPFDRHDWVVDRCGREVRYVIDYYHAHDARPGTAVFYVDARPALDGVSGIADRLRLSFNEWF